MPVRTTVAIVMTLCILSAHAMNLHVWTEAGLRSAEAADQLSGFSLATAPFASSSSWNTPIPASARYTPLAWPVASGSNYWVNWSSYSTGIYIPTRSDPTVQVQVSASWGYPAGTISVPLPAGVTGATGTDGQIVIIVGTTVHNFWVFKRTSPTAATALAYGRTDIVSGTGWGHSNPFLGAGVVAAGSSELAGMLVEAETDKGEINHALQIAMRSNLQLPGFGGEAISGDGSSNVGIVQEGARMGIHPAVAMPVGLSILGQKVFRAMQKYGVFDVDTGGSTTFRAQANAYDQPTIAALDADVNKLIPLLQKVN